MNDDINIATKAMLAMQRYSWEHGVASQALLESNETEWLILMMREAVHRQLDDGRTAIIGISNFNAVTDPCANGEPLGKTFELTNDKQFLDAYNKLLHWALIAAPRNKDGIVYHLEEHQEFWVDSMYMLPPFLAYAGYYDEAIKQINGYWNYLFNQDYSLLAHMWDDNKKQFKRSDLWGVGNGWAMSGISRVINLLPDKFHAERNELIKKVKILIDTSLKYKRKDDLFHDVINDTSTFVETNFPQMLAYTIYTGISSGWLDLEYKKFADNIRASVKNKIDHYGYVHGVCGAPEFNKPGFAVEGQAFHILMLTAEAKLN